MKKTYETLENFREKQSQSTVELAKLAAAIEQSQNDIKRANAKLVEEATFGEDLMQLRNILDKIDPQDRALYSILSSIQKERKETEDLIQKEQTEISVLKTQFEQRKVYFESVIAKEKRARQKFLDLTETLKMAKEKSSIYSGTPSYTKFIEYLESFGEKYGFPNAQERISSMNTGDKKENFIVDFVKFERDLKDDLSDKIRKEFEKFLSEVKIDDGYKSDLIKKLEEINWQNFYGSINNFDDLKKQFNSDMKEILYKEILDKILASELVKKLETFMNEVCFFNDTFYFIKLEFYEAYLSLEELYSHLDSEDKNLIEKYEKTIDSYQKTIQEKIKNQDKLMEKVEVLKEKKLSSINVLKTRISEATLSLETSLSEASGKNIDEVRKNTLQKLTELGSSEINTLEQAIETLKTLTTQQEDLSKKSDLQKQKIKDSETKIQKMEETQRALERSYQDKEYDLEHLDQEEKKRLKEIFQGLMNLKKHMSIWLKKSLEKDKSSLNLRERNMQQESLTRDNMRITALETEHEKLQRLVKELDPVKLAVQDPEEQKTYLNNMPDLLKRIFKTLDTQVKVAWEKNLLNENVREEISCLLSDKEEDQADSEKIENALKAFISKNDVQETLLAEENTDPLDASSDAHNPFIYNHFLLVDSLRKKMPSVHRMSIHKKRDEKTIRSSFKNLTQQRLREYFNEGSHITGQKNDIKKDILAIADNQDPIRVASLEGLFQDREQLTALVTYFENLTSEGKRYEDQFIKEADYAREQRQVVLKAIQMNESHMQSAKHTDIEERLQYQSVLKGWAEELKEYIAEQLDWARTCAVALEKLEGTQAFAPEENETNADNTVNSDNTVDDAAVAHKTLVLQDAILPTIKKIEMKEVAIQRLSSPEDVYIVSKASESMDSQKVALKILINQKSESEPDLFIYDQKDANNPLLPGQQARQNKTLENYRIVPVDQVHHNSLKKPDEYYLYYEQSDKDKVYLDALKNHVDGPLPEPDSNQLPPLTIRVHPPGSENFSKVHTTAENIPDKKDFKTSAQAFEKAMIHATLQMATRDLQKRIGNLQGTEAVTLIKKLKLHILSTDKFQAIALYTAYSLILERKYKLTRREVEKIIKVGGILEKEFKPKKDVYDSFGKLKLKGFLTQEICDFYEISKPLAKEIVPSLKTDMDRLFQRPEKKKNMTPLPPPPPSGKP